MYAIILRAILAGHTHETIEGGQGLRLMQNLVLLEAASFMPLIRCGPTPMIGNQMTSDPARQAPFLGIIAVSQKNHRG